jgi:GntR family transcriptional regulator, transcriptional repressor for pyruvate dehydrogenase complex
MPAPRASLALFTAVDVPRTVDAVVDQLADLIRSGKLSQGQLLPGERQLAAAMSVSRRTVREAIDVLEAAGVFKVGSGSGGGWRVASIWVPAAAGGPLGPLHAEQTFRILEARRILEPRIAQLAALRGTEQDFAVMRETILLQRSTHGDYDKGRQANARFHRQLWRAAGNPELEETMRSIYRKLDSVFETLLTADKPASAGINIHEATLEAVMRGNAEEIEAVMDDHLAHVEQLAEAHLGRARIRRVPDFLISKSRSGGPGGR